jgi:hypothetical protein
VDPGCVVHTLGGVRDIDANSRDGSVAKRAEPAAGCSDNQDRIAAYFAAIAASLCVGMPVPSKTFGWEPEGAAETPDHSLRSVNHPGNLGGRLV